MNNLIKFNLQLLANEDIDDITELRTKYTEIETKLNEQIMLNEELNKKYSVALENNQKLFLNQTIKIKEDNEYNEDNEDNEVNEYEEYVGKEVYNILSKSEQELLKTILEGDD